MVANVMQLMFLYHNYSVETLVNSEYEIVQLTKFN